MQDAGAAIERAREKTQQMQARASAMDELIQSGTLEDFTSDKTALDRELAQMASQSQVESELAAMKHELDTGDGGAKELGSGSGSSADEPAQTESERT
jgi:phage shock protein A